MTKSTVHSSNGELVIDESGSVIVDESTYDNDNLKGIVRFNVKEYKKHYPDEPEPGTYDILDLGYWTSDGEYEPPCTDWREQIRNEVKSGKMS